jgi:TolA-binding protein
VRIRLTVLSACVAFGALAGCTTITPTDDPVYLRLQDLEARLMRIERVVNNESLIELAGQLETMRSETQALRGEVETLRFETESAANRQRELYLDIDQRLQSLEQTRGAMSGQSQPGFDAGSAQGGAAAGGPGGAAAGAGRLVSGSDQDNYQAAFELLQNRRYPDAARVHELS